MPRGIVGTFVFNPNTVRVEAKMAETGATVKEWGQGPWSNIDPKQWSGDRYATGVTNKVKGERHMASVWLGGIEVARRDYYEGEPVAYCWAEAGWLGVQRGDEVRTWTDD